MGWRVTVLRSDLSAGGGVEGGKQLHKWPPPLFAVSCSTHFEKVRESEGGSVPLLSHFVLNKVSCLVQHMESTAAENSTIECAAKDYSFTVIFNLGLIFLVADMTIDGVQNVITYFITQSFS